MRVIDSQVDDRVPVAISGNVDEDQPTQSRSSSLPTSDAEGFEHVDRMIESSVEATIEDVERHHSSSEDEDYELV